MKTVFILAANLILFLGLQSCSNNEKKASTDLVENPASADAPSASVKDNAPMMSFEELTHDFGKIKEGEIITYRFKFKNTGKTDLLISSASASCGCTVPSYPKEPIAPGAEAGIDVQFNSKGKSGMFDKTITILANTIPSDNHLAIKGEVISESIN
jgi:hypothetical protein